MMGHRPRNANARRTQRTQAVRRGGPHLSKAGRIKAMRRAMNRKIGYKWSQIKLPTMAQIRRLERRR